MRFCRSSAVPALLAAALVGCYELQPHRLQRLNRGSGLSPEAYYSVADPDVPTGDRHAGVWQMPIVRVHSDGSDETLGALPQEPPGDFAAQ